MAVAKHVQIPRSTASRCVRKRRGVQKRIAEILAQIHGDAQLESADLSGQHWRPMLPLTLQFLIAMIASAINERTKRKRWRTS